MLTVWIPGKKLRAIFGERFALFNFGKSAKAFLFIDTFTNSWGVSSPFARN